MKISVTGGSGFIGSHLIPALLMNGHEIVCAVELGAEWIHGGVKVYPADIRSGEGIPEVLSGADAIVHLAARNHVLREMAKDPISEYRRVNVQGSRNMSREAARAGVRLFIHMSSVKAMGEESDRILDEQAACTPRTDYGISKLESEQAVREEAEKGGMAAAILRMPMVYGPRNQGNLPRMIRWADRGLPFPLFRPENLRSMAYVGNVVQGILLAIEKSSPGVSTYIVKDGEDYSARRLYTAICGELGKPARFLPIPAWMVRLGGTLSEDFRKVTGSFRVSSSKIEKELGYSPRFSLDEGIAETVRWYTRSVR